MLRLLSLLILVSTAIFAVDNDPVPQLGVINSPSGGASGTAAITGGTISNTQIGFPSPSAAQFTTLSTNGVITAGGGLVVNTLQVASSAGTTVLTSANVFVDVIGTTTQTIQLTGSTGAIDIVKATTSGNVTVIPSSGTIDGGASVVLTGTLKQSGIFILDGTNWCEVASH